MGRFFLAMIMLTVGILLAVIRTVGSLSTVIRTVGFLLSLLALYLNIVALWLEGAEKPQSLDRELLLVVAFPRQVQGDSLAGLLLFGGRDVGHQPVGPHDPIDDVLH